MTRMLLPLTTLAFGLALGVTPQAAQAKGCVRGAIVGGVAGHYAGHHGLIGAAGGCLVARHHYKGKEREAREREAQAHRQAPHP